ncbi:hypothetical protein OQH61_04575 [Helicobacter sp. MIT 21-1697]|uniref:hypothetical protein n=1 Tax=Helicobacter sp. MIT 21-1697 TaxID=2993733 RepID=UPI00224A6E15|nr:hypothetical protein [Helicobacter sp. MIT 21-1697]MCX2717008.1 hypothetical protein [Helicobacter sp. MIT 21-1697]
MKRIFLMGCIVSLICAEELQIPKLDVAPHTLSSTQNVEEKDKDEDTKVKAQVSKNFSIMANTIANEGYSEFELETGNTHLNEFEAPMSRYGVGIELNYSLKPNAGVKLNFFVSNILEIDSQRRGGKVKTYDNAQRYEENAYDYGTRVMYPVWANSIGMVLTILKSHRIVLTLRQTQLSNNDALLASSPQGVGAPVVRNVAQANSYTNLYAITTQVFLTYSYVF